MDGDNKTHIEHMQRVADEWYEKVRVGHLTRFDAQTAFNSTIMKSLDYPLLALTLTNDDCTRIMAPVLKVGLSNMGIYRAMARSLVYAPIKYQGIGIHKLYTAQGLVHIRVVLDHIGR